ncbi:MAG: hypothetical protein J7K73_02260 [Nanoarchaeota archaeon]|nr:hypothetical protein [Nanoarchaeota archaeon]
MFTSFFAGVIVGVIIVVAAVYIFAPEFIPNTPCLLDSNCHMQKVCCTWRCDSKDLSWWKCPDELCEFLNKTEKPDLNCGCENFKCKFS